jgi:polar amino acid transport system substrate-binding protein
MFRAIAGSILFLLLVPTSGRAESPLLLQIVELPPYMIIESPTSVSGLVIAPVLAALKKGGIAFQWQIVPAVRQLVRIKNNQERVCSLGWYKTPNREKFAKYSRPIVKDSGYAGFANNQYRPGDGVALDVVLNDPAIKVLIKIGFVHSEYLDARLANMKAHREFTYADMPLIFKMVAAGRAQITFAPLAEIRYYESLGVVGKDDFHVMMFKEMPSSGVYRYMMCSLKVEDELINKFNEALGK